MLQSIMETTSPEVGSEVNGSLMVKNENGDNHAPFTSIKSSTEPQLSMIHVNVDSGSEQLILAPGNSTNVENSNTRWNLYASTTGYFRYEFSIAYASNFCENVNPNYANLLHI